MWRTHGSDTTRSKFGSSFPFAGRGRTKPQGRATRCVRSAVFDWLKLVAAIMTRPFAVDSRPYSSLHSDSIFSTPIKVERSRIGNHHRSCFGTDCIPMDTKVNALAHVEHSASPRNKAFNTGAWVEQVTLSLNVGSLSAPQGSRSNGASLAIPIDEQPHLKPVNTVENVVHTNTHHNIAPSRHEPLRRDSLKRREALAKGHEGSRRRQRWENGSCQTIRAYVIMLTAWDVRSSPE